MCIQVQDGIEYADRTCMMGAHIYENDGPRMCFNGAKSWFFGWYSERGGHVEIQDSWHGKLAGIHAYLENETTEGEHSVVARVGPSTTDNHLYLMFNRKEGVNDGVAGDGDMVTVVEQNGPETAKLEARSSPRRRGIHHEQLEWSEQSNHQGLRTHL